VLAVEGWPVELLERGPLEALADRVVVGRAGRDATVADAELLEVAGEGASGELGAVVGQHPGKLGPDAGQPFGDVVDEADGVPGRLVPGDQGTDRIAGGGIDRRQLPDRADALELANIEGVQSDQITRPGREVAEPKRAVLGVGGQDAGRRGGQLGEGSHPLGPTPQPMTSQDLLHPRRRQAHPTLGEVPDQLAGAQGRPGDRFSEDRLDLLGWGRSGHHRRSAALG
jgi:hypothetical protein